jgi:EAL domain-containing protein (putative c-di-GMP-specific phosphodiesterase class I)
MNELNTTHQHGPTSENIIPFPRSQHPTLSRMGVGRSLAPGSRNTFDELVLQSLSEALRGQRLGVHFQSQICLASGHQRGVEALMRLANPNGNHFNTTHVISIAERYNLIDSLGQAVIFKACNQYAELLAQGVNPGPLAINVSPLELRRDDYVEYVHDVLEFAGLSFSDVEFEITEGHSLCDSNLCTEQLRTLTDLGAGLAIDDFGTGYAAWSHVLEFPVSKIKIDRSLIRPLVSDQRARTIVEHICKASLDLDITVVAEGVTGPEQSRLLLELGCGIGQGFGLGRPGTPSELVSRLANHSAGN